MTNRRMNYVNADNDLLNKVNILNKEQSKAVKELSIKVIFISMICFTASIIGLYLSGYMLFSDYNIKDNNIKISIDKHK